MKRLWLLAAFALVAAAQSDEIRAGAHDYTPPQLRLSVETRLVELDAVVRDQQGRPVAGLERSDFEILDQGKPRPIAAFSVETRTAEEPRTGPGFRVPAPPIGPGATPPIGRSTLLFFDDFHASFEQLRRTGVAAEQFARHAAAAGTRAAIFTASQGLVLDFTTNADTLTAAIHKLRPHPRISESGMQSCPRMTPFQAYLIEFNLDQSALSAAVEEARGCERIDPNERRRGPAYTGPTSSDPVTVAVRAQASATWEQSRRDSLNSFAALDTALALLGRTEGTRVLVMVSPGFLSGFLEPEMNLVIDRAIHSGIVINALDAKGVWAEAPGRPITEANTGYGFPALTYAFQLQNIVSRNDAMNAAMAEAASATGGLFFHGSNDLTGGMWQLAAAPETTYRIAFHPAIEESPGKFHKLKVQLTSKQGYYVQARPGYVAPTNAPAEATAELRPIDRAVPAADILTAFPIRVNARADRTEVALAIHVDVSNLKFAKHSGRHLQTLTFVGALLDPSGAIVAAKEGIVEFTLKDETLPRLTAQGFGATLSLAAPPGSYRARVVVQDAEGKLASFDQTVEIPK
jgi:VWFA-related protein